MIDRPSRPEEGAGSGRDDGDDEPLDSIGPAGAVARPHAADADAADDRASRTGPVAWMARNPVASNLLMLVLLLGGALLATRVKQEVFPEFELDMVRIAVAYPGASPAEVEQGILLAVEEAVRGLDGIKRITSVANEGVASTVVELETGYDSDRAASDIKSAIDRITSMPADAERPVVALASNRREVVSLMVYGDAEEAELRAIAERVRTGLLDDPKITQAELEGVRALEISIEIRQDTLRTYGLTLEAVAAAIRRSAIELPGGAVKTARGEILIRTAERRNQGQEFADVPIITRPDGTRVLLGEIATIRDGFEEADKAVTFLGKPAARVRIFRVGDETPIQVSDAVKAWMARERGNLPPHIQLSIWRDDSDNYRARIHLLLSNAQQGLILVLLILGLFLEARIAFWVTWGIPTSFLGAMLFLPAADVSFNMVSLFAFIIVLGMVVDDAIVVGENVHHLRQSGVPAMRSAILGAGQVGVPVVFSVLTTVAAFLPLLFVPGIMGKIFRVVPIVVISVLAISLVESLFILPAHLGHLGPTRKTGVIGAFNRAQAWVARGMDLGIARIYAPALRRLLAWRYTTVAAGLAVVLTAVGIIKGGHIEFGFMPRIESDVVTANAVMPFGYPVEETRKIRDRLSSAADRVLARLGSPDDRLGLYATVGVSGESGGGARGGGGGSSGSHLASAQIFLVDAGLRPFTAEQFAREWRKEVGEVADVDTLTFQFTTGPQGGQLVDIELTHTDVGVLEAAGAELAEAMRGFAGVKDVDDGFAAGKPQLDFRVRPEGTAMGLSAQDLARQLRGAYFGVEALRQQRGRDEVRVRVRLPEAERRSEHDLERMIVRTPTGVEVPLGVAAEVDRGSAYTQIRRVDSRRSISVNADVDTAVGSPDQINGALAEKVLPELMSRYPGLGWDYGGQRRERAESMGSLGMGFIAALFAIYALLAVPFRSYIQPVVVMTAIPFGAIGAVAGHLLLGLELSLMSMMGIVALAGVVVNDSLVLVDAANERRAGGDSHHDAIHWAGVRRFRPIMLTSLTTFFGLAPMILETSVQARFLLPMAVSLAFGIAASTVIVLVLVPCFYLLVEDIRGIYTDRTIHDPPGPAEPEDRIVDDSVAA